MKKYEVIQDFKGSPDGHTVIQFAKGSEIDHADLGDDLAAVALAEKWVKLSKAAEKEAKAKAKAEAEAQRLAAEEQATAEAAQREADIAALQADLERLNSELIAAADVGGETETIVAQIEAKQSDLNILLA